MLGSIPEYIVSYELARTAVHVNLYADSTATLAPLGLGQAASLRLRTKWPYASSVAISVELPVDSEFTLMLRIPSWVADPLVVVRLASQYGGDNSTSFLGRRGSYLKIHRHWYNGDALDFNLPMKLKATRYTGLTVIPRHERYAVEYGPILLAAVGNTWNRSIDSLLVSGVANPGAPDTWLSVQKKPIRGDDGKGSLRFVSTTNPDLLWMPYFLIQEELFEVFPAFAPLSIN